MAMVRLALVASYSVALPSLLMPTTLLAQRDTPTSTVDAAAFVPNAGQWPGDVQLRAAFGPVTAWVHNDGLTLQVQWQQGEATPTAGYHETPASDRGVAVRLRLMQANGDAASNPQVELGPHADDARRNYFIDNNPEGWVTGVRAHRDARIREALVGVDMVVRGQSGHLEYDLEFAAGIAARDVIVHCEGVRSVQRNADGSLRLCTDAGDFVHSSPIAWSEHLDHRTPIACDVELVDDHSFRFVTSGRPAGERLIIDPGIVWAGLTGTTGSEYGAGVRPGLDEAGNVYVGGLTTSVSFPTTVGAYQTSPGGFATRHAWLASFDPDGAMRWATYLGGSSGNGTVHSLAVDGNGVVTACGSTTSSTFPTVHAFDPTYNGTTSGPNGDGWLARLDPTLSGAAQLIWSTYLGGSGDDRANTVHIASDGVVTVAGATRSPDAPGQPFPNAQQPTFGGIEDGFIARFDPSAAPTAQLDYFTFFGGSGRDVLIRALVDDAGVVTADGMTWSADLPTTANAFATTRSGPNDHLLMRIDPSLPSAGQLLWATYVGGPGSEANGTDSHLAPDGTVTTVGWSQGSGFPTTPGAFDPTGNGGWDAVVYRMDPSQSGAAQMVWSTYVGGAGDEGANGLAVMPGGGVVLIASSLGGGLPTTSIAFQPSFAGGGFPPADAYIARLSHDGSSLEYASYLGGSFGIEYPYGIVMDRCGDAYVHGVTSSADFPLAASSHGGFDFFLARLDLLPASMDRFGTPTAGCDDTPQTYVDQAPLIGNHSFGLYSTGAPPSTFGLMLWSYGALPAPVPVPFFGFDLWLHPLVNPSWWTTPTDAEGRAFYALPVPNNPTLFGFTGYLQFVFWQPNCPTSGLSATCPLKLTVQ